MLFVVIALLVFITQSLFYHWWLIVVDAFLGALLLGKNGWQAFLSGFLAVALVWAGQAFYWNYQNEDLLANKIADLFFLPNSMALLGVTVLIGGLVGGFSALSGYSIKAFWQTKS
ncbi:MAG: hypothetical protein MUE85_13490 [Microscillaceae bacterium]|jgi:hypothetical protein|nr:hypothetical protein [Microscillaceae bacterium]